MGRITASDVPLPLCWPRPAQMTWSGTRTKPPPTPRRPPASPAMPPIAPSTRRSVALCGSIRESGEPADVEIHHLLIIQQFLARAFEAIPAEHQDVCPLGMPESLARVLLDDEHGHTCGTDLLNALPDEPLEFRRETRARLVRDEDG